MKRLEDFYKYPSVMSAEREIEVMHALMDMPQDYLENNFDQFDRVIIDLGMSHIDGGLYGIRRSNEDEFFKFADWLDYIEERLNRTLRFGSDSFRISFDDMVEEYPSMAEWDDDPPDRK